MKNSDRINEYNIGWTFKSKNIDNNNIFRFGDSSVCFINRGKKYNSWGVQGDNQFIYELSIKSKSLETAMEILDIIKCAHAVIDCAQFDYFDPVAAFDFFSDQDPSIINEIQNKPTQLFMYNNSLYFACKMACKAYGNAKEENAILKYDLARDLYDVYPEEFDPMYDIYNRKYYHSEHLRFAYSIIICYSIIEELGIEIRASKDKPSTLDGKTWNNEVLDDLKKRLLKNKINPDSTVPWLVRGSMIRPYRSAIISTSDIFKWRENVESKDFNINICEAILELSFMRDKKASHGVDNRVYELTIYDVQNAYWLCRHLLISYFDIKLEYIE